jgi:hypothetical protein
MAGPGRPGCNRLPVVVLRSRFAAVMPGSDIAVVMPASRLPAATGHVGTDAVMIGLDPSIIPDLAD